MSAPPLAAVPITAIMPDGTHMRVVKLGDRLWMHPEEARPIVPERGQRPATIRIGGVAYFVSTVAVLDSEWAEVGIVYAAPPLTRP